jgi:hypothetical protein
LIFYSGHGDLESGEAFVALEGGRLYRRELVERLLEPSPASRNHVVIDACRSSFFIARGPGGVRRHVETTFAASTIAANLPNTGFVLSTAGEAHEWERYRAGIFSHQVRSALRGAADADHDGRITYAELAAFLAAANQGMNDLFRPDFVVRPPIDSGPAATQELLGWPTRADTLVLDAGYVGHVFLESKSGLRLLDVHAAPGLQIELQLGESRPVYVRTNDGSFEWEVLLRGLVRLSRLVRREAEYRETRGAERVALAELFKSPFSRGLVDRVEDAWSEASIARDGSSMSTVQMIRETAPWVFVGAFSTGFVCTLLARDQLYNTILPPMTPHHEEKYEYLNLGAITMYSIAGLTAAAWIYAAFDSEEEIAAPAFLVAPNITTELDAASVSLVTSF